MNLLINEPPLQVLPSLAAKIGLNEAIFLQQLHFRSLISTNVKEGHTWVYKTFEEWHEEFPFWSVKTIKRIVKKLEDDNYLFSTSALNKMKMDRTKWYRVNYEACEITKGQLDSMEEPICPDGKGQNDPNVKDTLTQCHRDKMTRPITKEIKSIKKDNVEKHLDVVSVIDYLNKKTGRNYKASSKSTQRFVNARFREGYTFEDFKRVIDVKVKEWLKDDYWNKFLRPSTLFNPTNFENYLEESKDAEPIKKQSGGSTSVKIQPPKLDFGKGEF